MAQIPTPPPFPPTQLPDSAPPLTVERQLALQLAAMHHNTMMLHEQLGRFASEMLSTSDSIRRGSMLGLAQHLVGATAKMQALHHDGARTLALLRNDGTRRVEVLHRVERADRA